MDEAEIPFPRPDITPPNTNINFVLDFIIF